MRSDIYFCIYEKDYEKLSKYNIPLEDTTTKTRFEIRLKNYNAHNVLKDIVKTNDIQSICHNLIKSYVRFVNSKQNNCSLNKETNVAWLHFLNNVKNSIFTTSPEQFNLDRKINWIKKQVAPSLKMLQAIDKALNTSLYESIIEKSTLKSKDKSILKQVAKGPLATYIID